MADQIPQQQAKKSRYNYKLFVAFSITLLIISLGILANSYLTTGSWLKTGIELKGGTTVSIILSEKPDLDRIQADLVSRFHDISISEIRGVHGYELMVEAPSSINTTNLLDTLKAEGVPTDNASIRSVGAALGSSFFFQVQVGIIVSFILMAIVVFVMFRTFAPSTAVILSAVSDIVETMAFMQLFGIELSLSTFAALLMLIGYSVDTDLLLTARVLKGSSTIPIPERVKSAFKTGMTMTLTTIGALAVLFISNVTPVLSQIASVLLIGLVLDMVNTWIQNVAIIRRYAEKKGL